MKNWPELKSTPLECGGVVTSDVILQGIKLRQAAQQQLFNKALEDAENKLDEMEKAVSSDDIGKDLRSVKDLLHTHQVSLPSMF